MYSLQYGTFLGFDPWLPIFKGTTDKSGDPRAIPKLCGSGLRCVFGQLKLWLVIRGRWRRRGANVQLRDIPSWVCLCALLRMVRGIRHSIVPQIARCELLCDALLVRSRGSTSEPTIHLRRKLAS